MKKFAHQRPARGRGGRHGSPVAGWMRQREWKRRNCVQHRSPDRRFDRDGINDIVGRRHVVSGAELHRGTVRLPRRPKPNCAYRTENGSAPWTSRSMGR